MTTRIHRLSISKLTLRRIWRIVWGGWTLGPRISTRFYCRVSLIAIVLERALTIADKHWDHIGNPFPYINAKFYIGSGDFEAVPALQEQLASRTILVDWAQTPGQPVAAFEHSLDIYGDGSVLIVDAHGHTAGHNNLLVHTGPDEWILLASDGCHHHTLLSSEHPHSSKSFGKYRAHWEDKSVAPSHSYYDNVDDSEKHLQRMRACERNDSVMVIISHNEAQWRRWYGGDGYGAGPELQGWKTKGFKTPV
jgi:glyoxylase-like metal-dependent hydrolase (beta-lactamase superfamily II)